MIDNGIKLYGETDAYEHCAGILLSRLRPYHQDDVGVVLRAYFSAIESMYHRYKAAVEKQYVETNSNEQRKKYSYSISTLRRIKNNFRKIADTQLKKSVWRG